MKTTGYMAHRMRRSLWANALLAPIAMPDEWHGVCVVYKTLEELRRCEGEDATYEILEFEAPEPNPKPEQPKKKGRGKVKK